MLLCVLPQSSSVMERHAELPDDYVFSLTGTLCHHFLLALQCTLGKAPLDCIKAINTEQYSWKKKPLTKAPHSTTHFPCIPLPLYLCLHAQWCDITLKIFQQMQKSSNWQDFRQAVAVRGAEHSFGKGTWNGCLFLQFTADLRRNINRSHPLVHTSGVIN